MQTRDFCFWLQGIFEVGKVTTMDAEQVALVRQHLDLVFQHDPSITGVEHGPVMEDNGTAKPASVLDNPALDFVRRHKYPPMFKVAEPKKTYHELREKLLC